MNKKTVLLIALLAVWGCGEDAFQDPVADPVDTDLFGIYRVASYAMSPFDMQNPDEANCDTSETADAPEEFVVLYNSIAGSSEDAFSVLGGSFCATIPDCVNIGVLGPNQMINYAFQDGTDADGWTGGALLSPPTFAGDQCLASVQTHELTVSGTDISVRTEQRTVTFEPRGLSTMNPNVDCLGRDASEAAMRADDSSCVRLFELEATFEVELDN